jgi:hypothetical protein
MNIKEQNMPSNSFTHDDEFVDLKDHDHDSVDQSWDGPSQDFDSASNAESRATIQQQVQDQRSQALAQNETNTVKRMKIIVFVLLFLSMIAVALAAYFLTAKQENDEFEAQFYEDANKILSTMGSNLERILQASDAFVTSIVSLANATNQTWPYVVVQDWAFTAEKVRSLSNAVYVNTYHLVQPDQRKDWQAWTEITGRPQVDEAIAAIEAYDGMDWPITWNYTSWDVIHDYDEYYKENPGVEGVNTTGPWLPFWQAQPTIAFEPPYNWYVRNKTISSKIVCTTMC